MDKEYWENVNYDDIDYDISEDFKETFDDGPSVNPSKRALYGTFNTGISREQAEQRRKFVSQTQMFPILALTGLSDLKTAKKIYARVLVELLNKLRPASYRVGYYTDDFGYLRIQLVDGMTSKARTGINFNEPVDEEDFAQGDINPFITAPVDCLDEVESRLLADLNARRTK